ncbi:hypothetical protein [Lactococcus cremoris]|uniref:hypothetical protein n=1 Tax=Lactococcus lactis subsp. cremoris TaxID=1359 RepID=UPI00069815E1|nr:hypothetical protein [Lactococcus cremoris]
MSYEKQTWNKYDDLKTEEENIENGAVVTDNRMNHIEEGIYSHTIDISNPHKVTAAQVGLGNIQNFGLATEDEAKQGISNAKYMTPSLTQAVLSANINSIAYANSADGTDGFTTVYPNLNLLTGTSTKVVQANNWNMQVADIKYDKSLGGDLCASVMINNADHASTLAKGSARITIQTFDQSGKVLTSVDGNDIGYDTNGLSWCHISIDDNTASIKVIILTNNMTQNAFYSRLKIEKGTTATPWMPSASEVTTADWPKYVGFSNTVKTNKSASDYTWFPVKDSELTNKVESHINNKDNPHAVTASQVGAYSKAESDSKVAAISVITPYMYGAVGDGKTDDTVAIQNMFDDWKNQNIFIRGDFLITKTINIKNTSRVTFAGKIIAGADLPYLFSIGVNFSIDGGGIGELRLNNRSGGFTLHDNAIFTPRGLRVLDVGANKIGINVQTNSSSDTDGYIHANDITFANQGGTAQWKSIGIYAGRDSYFNNIETINLETGIYLFAWDNFIQGFHPWNDQPDIVKVGVGLHLGKNANDTFVSNYYNDTMKYGVVLDADLSLIMSNVLSMWNSEFYNEKSNPGNPFLLYYTDDKLPGVGKNVMISNSHFNQSPANSSNLTPIFSSIPETYATIPGYQYDSTWLNLPKTSGKVKLTDFEVATISETVNIGNGLSLNFQRKGEFVLVRFSGSLTAINSGTYFSSAVPAQWRPDGIKELIGHFASGALAFHVDLETDGRVKWWGDSGATGAPRGTAMYFLK